MRIFFATLLILSSLHADADEINLKLNKPIFTKNSAECTHGGVIKTKDITIYAKNFHYINEDGKHIVVANDNLLIEFGRYFIVGDSLTYDFNEKRGTIVNGMGTVGNIIAGGKEILLFEDNSIEIKDAFATASVTEPALFKVTSPLITISEKTKASTKTMVGKINNVPIIWLPSFGMTLDSKYKKTPPISYAMRVENLQVPIFIGRYKMYDDDFFQAYARLEYRVLFLDDRISYKDVNGERVKIPTYWYEGLGGALDTDYKSKNEKVTLDTRSFVSYNIWPLNPNNNRVALRYRLQGQYKGNTEDGKVETFVQWDKLSDRFMRTDFKTNIFEIKTLERNEALIKYMIDPAFISLYARPRLNDFQGFKQELPTFNASLRPIEFFDTKIYLEQTYNASFLDYLYAEEIRDVVPNFAAGRLSAIENLYRPFNIYGLNITPRVGFDGIFYSNSQNNDIALQGVCTYGGDASMNFHGKFDTLSHYIKPYLKYNGLTAPTSVNDNHFIFSIDDGYAAYNQLIIGLNNELYFDRFSVDQPTLGINLSAMRFFTDFNPNDPEIVGNPKASFNEPFSKGDIEFIWNYPRMDFSAKYGWNFETNSYDFFDLHYGWTVNDYIALSTTYRNRGQYYWRKGNHNSFILDSYRTIEDLQQTPISDPRYCFVNKAQVQIAPLWTFQVENNVGKRNPVYNEAGDVITPPTPYYIQTKFSLSMILSNCYRLQLNYLATNSTKDNAFSFSFDLM